VKLQVSAIRRAILPGCLLAVTGLACQAGAAQGAPSQTQTSQTQTVRTQTSQTQTSQTGAAQTGAPAALQLHVSGNKLVNANHATVVLHGVDRSGTEYRCVQGKGIFDGPSDQASISAMKSWDINAVRVPLNEACWNGENYVNPAYAGADYRSAIEAYVQLLNANGIIVILDLHWSDGAYNGPGCSSSQALCEKPMPDAAESVPFWSSVARAFKGDDAVIFDLFNEPHPGSVLGSETASWPCWLKGGSACPGFAYKVAGMQTLVNAVRATGANNVIMLGGLFFANDLTEWLKYEPKDPDHNLAASWHSYNINHCNNLQCWTSQVGPVIAKVPVIAGEIGENDCADGYINPLMAWLDSKSTSYLAWSWNANPGGCAAGPELINDYSGTPTPYGAGYQSHLRFVARHH
jgi:endoglucanase